MRPTVAILRRDWTSNGHGGASPQADFVVYLNGFRCRGWSSHGDMVEGYWGSAHRASMEAEKYAAGLVAAVDGVLYRGRSK